MNQKSHDPASKADNEWLSFSILTELGFDWRKTTDLGNLLASACQWRHDVTPMPATISPIQQRILHVSSEDILLAGLMHLDTYRAPLQLIHFSDAFRDKLMKQAVGFKHMPPSAFRSGTEALNDRRDSSPLIVYIHPNAVELLRATFAFMVNENREDFLTKNSLRLDGFSVFVGLALRNRVQERMTSKLPGQNIGIQALLEMLPDHARRAFIDECLKPYIESPHVIPSSSVGGPECAHRYVPPRPLLEWSRWTARAEWFDWISFLERPSPWVLSDRSSPSSNVTNVNWIPTVQTPAVFKGFSAVFRDEQPAQPRPSSTASAPAASKLLDALSQDEASVLLQYGTIVSEGSGLQALRGRQQCFTGREKELAQIETILSQKYQPHVVLLGEAGVGKTALAERVVDLLAQKAFPSLKGFFAYSLHASSVLSGAKYRGEMEERLLSVLKALDKLGPGLVLIDNLETLIDLKQSSVIAPILHGGRLKMIGALSQRLHKKLRQDETLMQLVTPLFVQEPSASSSDLAWMIERHAQDLCDFHHTDLAPGLLEDLISLTAKFDRNGKFPRKAIKILDIAGASLKDIPRHEDRWIHADLIRTILAQQLGADPEKLIQDDATQMDQLGHTMRERLFEQSEAIKALEDEITLQRSGLVPQDDQQKIHAAFLFAGPTGVGKTEMAKVFADVTGKKLIRFNMAEYMEAHSITNLLGSPRSFVGEERGGLLIEAIHNHPDGVLVLDEIEKAHPSMGNILLGLIDHGQICDGSTGHIIDASSLTLIVTTNVGAHSAKMAHAKQFGLKTAAHSDDADRQMNLQIQEERRKALEAHFSPEWLARFNRVIHFNPGTTRLAARIIQHEMQLLSDVIGARHRHIHLDVPEMDSEILNAMAQASFHKDHGARPVRGWLKQHLHLPLAKLMLAVPQAATGREPIKLKVVLTMTDQHLTVALAQKEIFEPQRLLAAA